MLWPKFRAFSSWKFISFLKFRLNSFEFLWFSSTKAHFSYGNLKKFSCSESLEGYNKKMHCLNVQIEQRIASILKKQFFRYKSKTKFQRTSIWRILRSLGHHFPILSKQTTFKFLLYRRGTLEVLQLHLPFRLFGGSWTKLKIIRI